MLDSISSQLETRLVTNADFNKHAAETTRIIVTTAGELRTALGDLKTIMELRSKREFYGPIRHNTIG